ncbi:hypothetical protein N0V86_007590 [Didymella sp. IMI 355093]|nr:hypothetical protein N0V86_007590 [Didymella sp. IMI 355093]
MSTDPLSSIPMWVCLLLSVALIALRISFRLWRKQRLIRGDYWCLLAAVFTVARLVANYYLLIYGSTRVLSTERRLQLLEPGHESSASEIVIGSKLVLATRTMLTCLLWCLKMAVFDLMARIISKMPYERSIVYGFWAVLFATFVASVTTVYIGCRPFDRHWQIHPDPGDCVVGNVWLFTYEVSNIVTDLMLMALPFTLICSVTVPITQRLRVMALFSIGIFLVAISVIRIVQGKDSRVQRGHTLWASLEILLAVVVAVTPTIYALAHGRHEDSSIERTHLAEYPQGRTFMEGAIPSDKHDGSLWTELHDETLNRLDSASSERALVGMRHQSMDVRIPMARCCRKPTCKPIAMPIQPHHTPRLTLLDSTFWEVLPANYEKIKCRWSKIATLHDEAKSDLLPSDRAGAVNSLKAELEMLEKDIEEYRSIVRGIDITDVAEMYVVAGKVRPRALQVAKQDFEDVEASLESVEDQMKEVRAELVYGFEK